MRASIINLLVAAGILVDPTLLGARAAPRADPYSSDWRVVAKSDSEGGMFALIDHFAIERAGQAVTFQTMTVFRQRQRDGGGGHNVETERFLADCGSRSLHRVGLNYGLDDAEPAPVVFTASPGDGAAPDPDSVYELALRTVCGELPFDATTIRHPVAWAKAQWSARR